MKRFYTKKERPYNTVIDQFPNDGTFVFHTGSGGEMFFYMIDDGKRREKDVDSRTQLAALLKEYDYIGVDIDYIGGRMLQIPVFEKKSTALDDYERAMGIIGRR